MTTWTEKKLGELIIIKHGYAFKGKYFVDYPTPNILLTPGNFAIGGGFQLDKAKYYDGSPAQDYVLRSGDLIVTMTDLSKQGDTLGYPAKIPNDEHHKYLHNQRIGLITKKSDDIDLKFLYYLMRTHKYQRFIVGSASGSTVHHTSPTKIYEYQTKIPDRKSQGNIASIMACYDNLIDNNEKRIKILEEMAQRLYTEWFVKFKFPGCEKVKMVDSVFGKIPEEWEVKKVKDALKFIGGGTPSRKDATSYWNTGLIDWYTPTDLSSNTMFINSSSEKITEKGLAESSAKLFPAFSVMLTSRATIGRISINTKPATTNQGFIVCIPNQKVPLYFLYFWLKRNIELFIKLGRGATFKEITKGSFGEINLVIPDKNLTILFQKKETVIGQEILNLQIQIQNLIRTRDLLIPQLVAGKRLLKS